MRLTAEQAQLVEDHRDVARLIVRKIWWPQWREFPRDEIQSLAAVALCSCALTFRPDQGACFRTYLNQVLPLRIVDEWRRDVGRSRYRRTDTMYLDDGAPGDGDGAVLDAWLLVDERDYGTVELAASLAALPMSDQERTMIDELGRGATLTEAGAAAGVTESRACQVRRTVRERYYAACQ